MTLLIAASCQLKISLLIPLVFSWLTLPPLTLYLRAISQAVDFRIALLACLSPKWVNLEGICPRILLGYCIAPRCLEVVSVMPAPQLMQTWRLTPQRPPLLADNGVF